jgi:transporter family protein
VWIILAFASALFAGITAILAKGRCEKNRFNAGNCHQNNHYTHLFMADGFGIAGSWTSIYAIDTKSLIFLILSGLATGASWLCYFKALQLGDVNKVTPIDKFSTVLTMIFAFIILGESITLAKFAGMTAIGDRYLYDDRHKENTAAKNHRHRLCMVYICRFIRRLCQPDCNPCENWYYRR